MQGSKQMPLRRSNTSHKDSPFEPAFGEKSIGKRAKNPSNLGKAKKGGLSLSKDRKATLGHLNSYTDPNLLKDHKPNDLLLSYSPTENQKQIAIFAVNKSGNIDLGKVYEETQSLFKNRIRPPEQSFEFKDIAQAENFVLSLQKLLNTGDERQTKFEGDIYLEALLQQVCRLRQQCLKVTKAAAQAENQIESMQAYFSKKLQQQKQKMQEFERQAIQGRRQEIDSIVIDQQHQQSRQQVEQIQEDHKKFRELVKSFQRRLDSSEAQNLNQVQVLFDNLSQGYQSSLKETTELKVKVSSNERHAQALEDKAAKYLEGWQTEKIQNQTRDKIRRKELEEAKEKLLRSQNIDENQKFKDVIKKYNDEIAQNEQKYLKLQQENELEKQNSEKLEQEIIKLERKLNDRIKDLQLETMEAKEKINQMEKAQIKEQAVHSKLVGKITSQQNETQNKLNIEEKERNLNAMKLQQMVAMHRNLLAQKKFLKATINKSLGNIQAEIRKGQLEYRQVGLINVRDAQEKLQIVFALTQQTLEEVIQVIEFMSVDENQKLEEIRESRLSSRLSGPGSRLSAQIESRKSELSEYVQKGKESDLFEKAPEMAQALILALQSLLKKAKQQDSPSLQKLMEAFQDKVDAEVVSELSQQYLLADSLNFQQFIDRLSDKCESLYKEKKILLNDKENLLKQQQQIQLDQVGARSVHSSLHNREGSLHIAGSQDSMEETHKSVQEQLKRGETSVTERRRASKISQHRPEERPSTRLGVGSMERRSSSPEAAGTKGYQTGSQNSQMQAIQNGQTEIDAVIFQNQDEQIQSLKLYQRELKISLTQQILDLKEGLKIEQQENLKKLNQVKKEHGKDLLAQKIVLEKQMEEQKKKLKQEGREELERVTMENEEKTQNLQEEKDAEIQRLQGLLEQVENVLESTKTQLLALQEEHDQREVRKSAWSTFTIALNPERKSRITEAMIEHDQNEDIRAEDWKNKLSESEKMKVNLGHFIQVGFLFDKQAFKHCQAYHEEVLPFTQIVDRGQPQRLNTQNTERTNETREDASKPSALEKYLYSFNSPVKSDEDCKYPHDFSITKLKQLQHTIRQQMAENQALFDVIHPEYVSINLGRAIKVSSSRVDKLDRESGKHSFRVVFRQNCFVNMKALLITILLDHKGKELRVYALDSIQGYEFSFLLTFEDIMLLTDGNQKYLPKNPIGDGKLTSGEESYMELCKLIVSSLTLIQMEENDDEDDEDSKKIVTKKTKGRKRYILACEHRIYFAFDPSVKAKQQNKHYRQMNYDLEKQTQTDFTVQSLYEEFTPIFQEEVELGLRIFQLELYEAQTTRTVRVNLQCGQIFQETLYFTFPGEGVDRSIELSSKLLVFEEAQVVVSIERPFYFRDHLVLKLTDPVTKRQHFSYLVKQEKVGRLMLNSETNPSAAEFVRVEEFSYLDSVERQNLFESSFGYQSSNLSFGNQKELVLPLTRETKMHKFQQLDFLSRQAGYVQVEDRLQLGDAVFYKDSQGSKQVNVQIYNPSLSGTLVLEQKYCQIEDQSIWDRLLVTPSQQGLSVSFSPQNPSTQELIRQHQIQSLQEFVEEQNRFRLEIGRDLIIPMIELTKCERLSKITLVTCKLLKITVHFLQSTSNLKVNVESQGHFDWKLVQILGVALTSKETSSGAISDPKSSFNLTLTETDFLTILQQKKGWKEKQKLTKEEAFELILDCLIFDEERNCLDLSCKSFFQRQQDKEILQRHISTSLGRSREIEKVHLVPEVSDLSQNLVQRKLIHEAQQQFASYLYNIKIFESSINEKQTLFQVEICCLEFPTKVYELNYASKGSGVFMHRFNLAEEAANDLQPNKFLNAGLVAGITEKAFPHKINFTILEPASNIIFEYTHVDKKLQQMESRPFKEYQMQKASYTLREGVFRNKHKEVVRFGYKQQENEGNSLGVLGNKDFKPQSDICPLNLRTTFSAQAEEETLIYAACFNLQKNADIELLVTKQQLHSDYFKVEVIYRTEDEEQREESWFSSQGAKESGQLYLSSLKFQKLPKNEQIVLSFEHSSAGSSQESLFRVGLECFNTVSLQRKQLVDFILADQILVEQDSSQNLKIAEDQKLSLGRAYGEMLKCVEELPAMKEVSASVQIELREHKPQPRKAELPQQPVPQEQESQPSGTPVLRNSKFSIKRKFINDLLTGQWVDQEPGERRRLVVLRRDETIFEVSEVTGQNQTLDLQVHARNEESLELLGVGRILEPALARLLQHSGRLQLLEGQNKQKLASYLVENLWVDAKNGKLRTRSSVELQHEPPPDSQEVPGGRASLETYAEASS